MSTHLLENAFDSNLLKIRRNTSQIYQLQELVSTLMADKVPADSLSAASARETRVTMGFGVSSSKSNAVSNIERISSKTHRKSRP